MGLFDAYLIKENHLASCGSITRAVELARQQHPGKRVEVEVENLTQLDEALASAVEMIMLDNFRLNARNHPGSTTQPRPIQTKFPAISL